jgi:hypothetical protein
LPPFTLVLVPSKCPCPVQVRRVLAAVDAARARQSTLLRALKSLVGTRPEVTVLHVADDAATPAFEDQPGHALEAGRGPSAGGPARGTAA